MSTPSRFFSDCIDLEAGEESFETNFQYPTATDPGEYHFPVHSGLGSRYHHAGETKIGERTNLENPYGAYDNHVDFEVDYDSTTTGMNSSTTSNTQASTRRTSTTGSYPDSHSSKSRRSHNSRHDSQSGTSASADALTEPPTKKKPGRKSTKHKSSGTEEEDRRNKFLERNRVAASKCRQKKKEWVSGLEDQKAGLENRHSHLQMEYNGLLGEVSGLKEELMNHAKCNDPNINQWLENEARKFVQETSEKLSGGGHRRSSHGSRRQYSNVDPMLGVGNGSSAGCRAALEDDMAFSPTTIPDGSFDDGQTMFGHS